MFTPTVTITTERSATKTAPTSGTFTVTRTTAVASKKSLLTDRTDLRMAAQHRAARLDQRMRLQAALVQDYTTTVGSRDHHARFLRMMLTEVQKYHSDTFGHVLPTRALEILAERNVDLMDDDHNDHYATCLALMARDRLYTRAFFDTAAQMVAEEEALRRQQQAEEMYDSWTSSAEGSSSSAGLSEDDDVHQI